MNAFLQTYRNPTSRIDQRLTTKTTEQVQKNRKFLRSIIRCIEYCGRQGISLRDDRDDGDDHDHRVNHGNFRALLNLFTASGDDDLHNHLETCAKNAKYISKTGQNELIGTIKEYMQEVIVEDVLKQSDENGLAFYGIEADEVRDVSNKEQFGIVVRYIKDNTPVEKLLEFLFCEEVTGSAICEKLVACLTRLGLDPKLCRA